MKYLLHRAKISKFQNFAEDGDRRCLKVGFPTTSFHWSSDVETSLHRRDDTSYSYSALTTILSTAFSFYSSLTSKMDTGKIAQEALTYAKGLTDGNAAKSPLIATAEKWIADHSKNPMSMTALGDANKIKVSSRYYGSTCWLPERAFPAHSMICWLQRFSSIHLHAFLSIYFRISSLLRRSREEHLSLYMLCRTSEWFPLLRHPYTPVTYSKSNPKTWYYCY